jgi:hypothetical protein
MEAQITFSNISPSLGVPSQIVQIVRGALKRAIAGETRLPVEVLSIVGMSGRKYRSFVNNLIENLPNPRYLEIGSWAGSTLCSAIHNNDVDALAIDNWSEFGGPATQFFENLSSFKGRARVSFLEKDFNKVDFGSIGSTFGTFNVYLFDGPHDYWDQINGVAFVQPVLEPCYVQIVDDWNAPQVRNGTMKAIETLGLRIEFMAEIRTSLDDLHAVGPTGAESDWHNGYCISVLSR